VAAGTFYSPQAPSLSERANLPLPKGVVLAGDTPVVAVAAVPAHPSNTVLVEMRRDGGPAQYVRAVPEAAFRAGTQWFRAVLPAPESGRDLDYRVALYRAGQRLAQLPTDGSWLSITAARASSPDGSGSGTTPAPENTKSKPPPVPRWGYELSFLAALTLDLEPEVIGESGEGYRINILVRGGTVAGPRIDAIVRPNGGDWMCIRRDGIGVIDVRITYETSDGALILDRAGGVFDLGPDGYAKVVAGQLSGWPPVYATATFSTGHPKWAWLNRCQGFGIGRVALEKRQVQCDIYVPRVLDRLPDG
jgi:hypothetical protein